MAKGGKSRAPPPPPRELTPIELAQKQREQDAKNRQAPGVSQGDAASAIAVLGAGQGNIQTKTTPAEIIRGSQAMITRAGSGTVLSFRTPDGNQMKYQVERPPQGMQINSTSGNAGNTWLAFNIGGDSNDNRVITLDGGNVSAQLMTPAVKQGFDMAKRLTSHP